MKLFLESLVQSFGRQLDDQNLLEEVFGALDYKNKRTYLFTARGLRTPSYNANPAFLQAIIFQPLIKDFHLATLYGMPGIPVEPQEGYALKTGGIVNTAIISEQWDTIQRLMVTIKLNHALPSTLLRWLTSYTSYNPVYHALRELGRIVKTTFLFQ